MSLFNKHKQRFFTLNWFFPKCYDHIIIRTNIFVILLKVGAGRCQYPLPPRLDDRGKSLALSPPRHLYSAGKIHAGWGKLGQVGAKLPSLTTTFIKQTLTMQTMYQSE